MKNTAQSLEEVMKDFIRDYLKENLMVQVETETTNGYMRVVVKLYLDGELFTSDYSSDSIGLY